VPVTTAAHLGIADADLVERRLHDVGAVPVRAHPLVHHPFGRSGASGDVLADRAVTGVAGVLDALDPGVPVGPTGAVVIEDAGLAHPLAVEPRCLAQLVLHRHRTGRAELARAPAVGAGRPRLVDQLEHIALEHGPIGLPVALARLVATAGAGTVVVVARTTRDDRRRTDRE